MSLIGDKILAILQLDDYQVIIRLIELFNQ